MRTNIEFWDDVVIACIGATQRLPHPVDVMADMLLEERQKRVKKQWDEEGRARVEALKPNASEIDMFRHRPIEGIKAYRERTGATLVESKRVMEEAAGAL